METLIGAALPAIRWLHLVALLAALGAEAFRLLSHHRLATDAKGAALLGGVAVYARLCMAAAFVSGIAWFWLQGGAMLGRPLDGVEAVRTVAGTRFGEMLLLRAGLLVLALAFAQGRGPMRVAAPAWLAAAAALQGWLGHGAATDPVTASALGLHVVAAGLWLGYLPPLLLACRRVPRLAPALARCFTPLGLLCVAVLAVTSLLQAQVLIGTLAATLGTSYGRLALAKLALFTTLLGLAAANRFRFVPGAESGDAVRGLALSIALETGAGLAIVAVAAALASQPPAIHEQPVWPFALRPVPGLWDDAYLRYGLLRLLVPLAMALALFILAAFVRGLRWPVLIAGVVALGFVRIPPWRPYAVAAVPTSFQLSPTGYDARSIATGRALFGQSCARCHGRDARGRGPDAVARAVWPPDLSAPLIAGRPSGELFWSIRHGVGPMPAAPELDDAAIWSLVDFIRLRAGARIFAPGEMGWGGATRMPGFVARCGEGGVVMPGNGAPLRIWIGRDGSGAQVQLDGAAGRCPVEDPQPLAEALAELTGGALPPPALVLVDANGWLRRAFRTEADATPDVVASELARIRDRPLAETDRHH
ncbi:CopD family protein [Bosea sp. (in: a-proteobacteria)]|uniref:CopD family protein n=1 Tax=Bosea sp. (in: a-proteobacteria) TaxID=1871050 RepID=UPI003342B8CC